jgi:rSAM/selenodomain-associated transferase 2
VSVIIPTFDEEAMIGSRVADYAGSGADQVVVSDGGSRDDTRSRAADAGALVVEGPTGRALQLNRGAAAARGEVLVFMHADTAPPQSWCRDALATLSEPGVVAGAFDFGVPPGTLRNALITAAGRIRTRLIPVPYGDQGLFLRRETFVAEGGYSELPIMEDWEFVRRLQRRGRVRLARSRVQTSTRRWDAHGMVLPTATYAAVIGGYLLGVDPVRLDALRRRVDAPDARAASRTETAIPARR